MVVYGAGQSAKYYAQVLNADGSPANSASVSITIYNPDGTKYIDGASMTYISGSQGIYEYSLTTPGSEGIYAVELVSSNPTAYASDVIEVIDAASSSGLASAVWDVPLNQHQTRGTTGYRLKHITGGTRVIPMFSREDGEKLLSLLDQLKRAVDKHLEISETERKRIESLIKEISGRIELSEKRQQQLDARIITTTLQLKEYNETVGKIYANINKSIEALRELVGRKDAEELLKQMSSDINLLAKLVVKQADNKILDEVIKDVEGHIASGKRGKTTQN